MNPQTTPNPQSRYCIQRIELKSTKKVKNKICARLLIDGEVVHKLPPIKKGQPLVWDRSIFCDAGPNSVFRLKVHEESYFGLRRTPKYRYEFPASELQSNRSDQLIERTSNTLSALFSFSNPETALPGFVDAVQNMEAPVAVLDRLGRLRPAVQTILDFGTAVSEINPIAKAALSVLQTAWKKLEEQTKCDEAIEQILVGFADILRSVRPVKELARSEDLRRTIIDIFRLIQGASEFIRDYRSETEAERVGSAFVSSPKDKVEEFLGDLKRLKENFDRELSVQEHLDRMDEEISKLKPAARCTFHHRSSCLKDTRTTIINDIDQWIQNDSRDDRLLWVHGLAGLGKSSIATSICQLLEGRYMLAASFFCKRDNPELRDPQRALSTIIYHLARHYADYRKLVVAAIHNDPTVCDLPVRLQYNKLVKDPLVELANHEKAPTSSFIVLVDALDECGTNESRRELLSCLLDMSRLVSWLNIIVTSRPDQDILEVIEKTPGSDLKRMDVREYEASDDIYAFLQKRMGAKSGSKVTFDDTTIQSLKARAAGLFIWAETACRFILGGFNPKARLKMILENSAVDDATAQLDALYSTAIKSSMVDTSGDNLEILKTCLGAVVATGARTALSVASLEKLLRNGFSEIVDAGVLGRVVKALGSVLYEDSSAGSQGAVRVYHPSFADYITTPSRSRELCVDLAEQDAMLSTCCLNTMLKELRFNICHLETSYRLDKDVPDLASRVSSAIGPHLDYSCQYWISHVIAASSTRVDMDLLRKCLFGRTLFYWIEALSLLKKLGVAISMLPIFIRWKHSPDDCSRCASDAYRFILNSYDVISESTPHLYLSAFPFAPIQSGIVQRGLKWFPNIVKVIVGAQKSWTACLRSISHPQGVMCVALSPDGRRIVSGSSDNTVRIWDAETGAEASPPLNGHSGSVWSVAFSPDGRRIVSGSSDNTVRIWDAETGAEASPPLNAHSGTVLSVAFSHDGRRIVSGSEDKTVRIWDAETGAEASPPLNAHSGTVWSVAFSPDGRRIVSGSEDKTVRIWDAETGAEASPPLNGHSGSVYSVAFSPDGRRIVSGSSDKTVRIWDAETGAEASQPLNGHSGPVWSVAFSPDGRRIVSGSDDKTVRIWDAETGAEASPPLNGHSDSVCSVVFSPDGRRIVSGSEDKTVRIWDAETGAEASQPLNAHSGYVWSVAFSPDGRRIVSGSGDKTVRIWDAETGAEASPPLNAHSGSVWSVAFSPDGRRIVSGSGDKTVRIWDAETGAEASPPLNGHSGYVLSVAFSPDGRRIVSGSGDKTVRIWDAETGAEASQPLNGHSGSVYSVAFSPDGRRIVSGSEDKTVRIWDAETGAEASQPLNGHSGYVYSVAFSPDGRRIVSGSEDKTVRIWDAETGAEASPPLNGHSDSVCSVVFSPDGRRIVSGSEDKTVRIWDAETGAEASQPLNGHSDSVYSVVFSPDGRRIVSGSEDNTVRTWDSNPNTAPELPANMSHLSQLMNSEGWVSHNQTPFLLYIPSEYRRPHVDDSLLCISIVPSSSPILLDFSNFAHGTLWTSVAAA